MNTTSKPDDPDGRVVTDRAGSVPATDASPPPAASGKPGSSPPNGSGGRAAGDRSANGSIGSGGPTAPGEGPASAATPPDGAPASPGSTPDPAADPGEFSTLTAPRPPRPTLAAVPRIDALSSSDTPTAKLRVQAAPNGATRHPSGLDEAARSGGRGQATSAGPGGTTTAGPPPWHRVPGLEPVESVDYASARNRPIGGLLDGDEPTAFLTAPADPDPDRAGKPAQRSSGWAAVRAVRGRPPRQAALQLKRLDPWSVLKLALVLAVVLFLIWLVAVGVLYGVLDGIGVWDRLNGTYADLVSGEAQSGSPLISAGRVFTLAAVVGAINSLLFAVAVTVGAFVYNVSADLVGGIEVTLSERD